jgi:2-polyprenyl-6-methoxyphenol hydroxylase-like FAD-dependent oxidoreductase
VRVVICGAGVAGLALAHALKGSGAEVVVLERSPRPRRAGYMIDFFGPGFEAAEATGLAPRLRQLAQSVEAVDYRDERGRIRASMDVTRYRRAARGRLISLMRSDLELALRESAAEAAELRFGAEVVDATSDGNGAHVTLADGARVRGDVVVGADGLRSAVRRTAFGPDERFIRRLGFHTAAYIARSPELAARVGDRAGLTDSARRMLGFWTTAEDEISVFAVHRTAQPEPPAEPREVLLREYSDLGWIAPQALELCPPSAELYYDLVAQVVAPRWSRGRVVLLGDAAHAPSLLSGQGASLGVAGGFLLAERLISAPSAREAITEFERAWHPVTLQRQRAGRRAAGSFLPATAAGVRLRRLVLRATSALRLETVLGSAVVGTKPLPRVGTAQTRGDHTLRRTPPNS